MKQRATILLVFAVFLTPVILATLMHSQWWQFEPETRNYGQLVEPVVALDQFAVTDTHGQRWDVSNLTEHWTLLAISAEPCTDACVERLTWLARLRETQGRHLKRVNVLVVSPNSGHLQSPPEQDRIVLAQWDQAQGTPSWAQQLPANEGLNTTYLVDPVGNVMMRYPADSDPTGIRKDLKRILTWSKADNA
jgi:cytochrome oxidase Cu insertion factor (SCO1/SenC/PrrC family)